MERPSSIRCCIGLEIKLAILYIYYGLEYVPIVQWGFVPCPQIIIENNRNALQIMVI